MSKISLKADTLQKIDLMIKRYPDLSLLSKEIKAAVTAICSAYRLGKKLLVCGNGGSAADAEHLVGELMKTFSLPRALTKDMENVFLEKCPSYADYFMQHIHGSLPAISLVSPVALNTAIVNDQPAQLMYAQQIYGLGETGDILIAISTSGNSSNIIYALAMARAKDMTTIVLTGASGGRIVRENLADIAICVPSEETYRVQEYHLPVYHAICLATEHEFFGV